MIKTSVLRAPYSPQGHLLHWVSLTVTSPDYEWRPNTPFEECLTLEGMRSGMSAKYVIWRTMDGRTFPMFIADLIDLVRRAENGILGGQVTARWMVSKRGKNYGIRLAKDGE